MKKRFVFVAIFTLFTIPTSQVNALSSNGQSWIENEAIINPVLYNYLTDNAGVASYIYTERNIDLDKAKKLFAPYGSGIIERNKNYIIGLDYNSGHGLLVTKDGLIVNFLEKGYVVRTHNWYDSHPLDIFLTETVKRLLGPTLTEFNHINFQHPDAERFLTVSIRAKVTEPNLVIPSDVNVVEFVGGQATTARNNLDYLNPTVLQPGNLTVTKDSYHIYVNDKRVSNKEYDNDYAMITYSGSPIIDNNEKSGGLDRFSAEFELENKFKQVFYDVSEQNDHFGGVSSLVKQDIIKGYPTGNFKPWNNIQRQHVAVILYRTLGMSPPSNLNSILNVYKDVNSNTEYSEEIAAVTKEGIFGGAGGYFNANKDITREQMATVLVRGLKLKEYDNGADVNVNLTNVDPSHKESVQILANLGITNQLDDFRPNEKISRGAFSTFLNNTLKIVR